MAKFQQQNNAVTENLKQRFAQEAQQDAMVKPPVEEIQQDMVEPSGSSTLQEVIAAQQTAAPEPVAQTPAPQAPTTEQIYEETKRAEVPDMRTRLEDTNRVDKYHRMDTDEYKASKAIPRKDGGLFDRARDMQQAVATGKLGISKQLNKEGWAALKEGQDPAAAMQETAPTSIPTILSSLGAQQNTINDQGRQQTTYDPKFWSISSVVTENMMSELFTGDGVDAFELEKNLGPGSEEFITEGPEASAVITKAQGNERLGRQIAIEYAKSTGKPEPQLSKDQATVLGDAMKEAYAEQNPDVVRRVSEGSGSQVYYQLTAEGSDLIAMGAAKRKRMFPKAKVRPQKTPLGKLVGDAAGLKKNETGTVGKKGGRGKLEEAKENMNTIPNVVDKQRLRILYSTALPVLAGQQDALTPMYAEINSVGASKQRKYDAAEKKDRREREKNPNKKGQPYNAAEEMETLKDNLAQSIYGIAMERNGANFLTYYTQAYNGRLAPQQTHFDPTTSKAVRFVTRNATPVTIKPGSRQDRNIRQMYAMMLVKDADMKLDTVRDSMLTAATPQLLAWGRRLNDVLKGTMSDAEAEAISAAIEKGIPMNSPEFPQFKGLQLDPEADKELIEAIADKKEDGPHFIDGLIDFVEYYEKVIKKNQPHHSYFNAYMDGKTNGLAANGIQMGSEPVALATGVIRTQAENLLDAGDIRDQLQSVLLDELETNGIAGVNDELSPPYYTVAKAVFSFRDLNKSTTMTFGYGQDMEAFAGAIEETMGELYEMAISQDEKLIKKHGLQDFAEAYEQLSEEYGGDFNEVASTLLNPYSAALTTVLSEEGIAARSLMKGSATVAALAGVPLVIHTYSGTKLALGGNVSAGIVGTQGYTLSSVGDKPVSVKVDQGFIDFRNQRKQLFEGNNQRTNDQRSDEQKLKSADKEFIEYHIQQLGLGTPAAESNRFAYDYTDNDGNTIDVKMSDKGNLQRYGFSLKPASMDKLRRGEYGDYFEFWEKVDWPNRPLQVGDSPSARLVGRVKSTDLIAAFENKGGAYAWNVSPKKLDEIMEIPSTTTRSAAQLYETRATAAAPKIVEGEAQMGRKAVGGSVPGPVQSLDAETIALSVTGKSWDRLKNASGGNPYFHSVYDAVKMDANGYDVLLEEVNNNWLKAAMGWSYLKEMKKAGEKISTATDKELAELKDTPVDTSPSGQYAMIGAILTTDLSMKGNHIPKKLFRTLKNTMEKRPDETADEFSDRVWGVAFEFKNKYGKYFNENVAPDSIPANVARAIFREFLKVNQFGDRFTSMINKTETNKNKLYKKIKAQGPVLQYYAH